ncbi:MAG: GntG family PLP-dependent aldolase [Deltaproteobacteria bacterium]|nr:GntG family PLP-dependent aldolase [Deltaproteobacteria bacterium]
MRKLEFRSDTMTRPTPAMRDAMRDAEVGDDMCGEDPTVNRLEAMAADLLGKEAGLFVPSGVFGNQCAIAVHARPGEEVVVSETAHVVEHEQGASAALSGVQLRTVEPRAASYLTAAEIAPRIRVDLEDVHIPRTALVVLENALADGTVMPLDAMREVRELTNRHGIKVHLDGARLFNAALALGVEAKEIAALVDSVSFCLSKGLGAPVGSVLCGAREFVRLARRRRKVMGGAMRQAGVLAAPGIVALTEGMARLRVDHENARLLAGLFSSIPGITLDLASVRTNMVYCRVRKDGRSEQGLVDFLAARGILVYPALQWGLRFVTSCEVDEDDVRALAAAVADYMEV